jgi:dihydrofolate reductase
MKVVLYAATTVDRFIADENGNSDWVLDDELFTKTVQKAGIVALGQTTFEQYSDIYPLSGVQHLVLTKKKRLKPAPKNVHYVTTAAQALKKAKALGFKKLFVIGGGRTNGSFLAENLVDELWIDLHAYKLEKGVKLVGDFTGTLDLKPISQKAYPEGFLHCRFKIVKSTKPTKNSRAT